MWEMAFQNVIMEAYITFNVCLTDLYIHKVVSSLAERVLLFLTMLFSISHVESEPLSMKNLKRRSEFFEQGKEKRKKKKKKN